MKGSTFAFSSITANSSTVNGVRNTSRRPGAGRQQGIFGDARFLAQHVEHRTQMNQRVIGDVGGDIPFQLGAAKSARDRSMTFRHPEKRRRLIHGPDEPIDAGHFLFLVSASVFVSLTRLVSRSLRNAPIASNVRPAAFRLPIPAR